MGESKTDVVSKRTLLIGLGGTGGHVLNKLYDMLSSEQKRLAKCLYLDMDSNDITELRKQGVRSELLSSSDTVANVAASLGAEDGVYDWLPCDVDKESNFLESPTDNGASQFRYKSRLCLARFLKNRANALNEILDEMNRPGSEITEKSLRVMIVSSVAGGTGAGTFIQVALYLRKYFRELGQPNIQITGLFACPEVFRNANLTDQERENTFANAYAAIRELNAMNLSVSGTTGASNEYGKFIKLTIWTASEGKLFDSKDPTFTRNYNSKPYDLMYFIDRVNVHGALLSSMEQYYKTMADIVYIRLFSELEADIQSGESNELAANTKSPTAIYGSAGYGRVVYPYEDILRYLAERKTADELDYKWSYFDTQWRDYCEQREEDALAMGLSWKPGERERGEHFIGLLTAQLENNDPEFMFLDGMIGRQNGRDRADTFFKALRDSIYCSTGFDNAEDGKFSLGKVKAVSSARSLVRAFNDDPKVKMEKSYRNRLEQAGNSVEALRKLATAMNDAISMQANALANAVIPMTEDARRKCVGSREAVNLYGGLLSSGEGRGIHPLAARFLLYRVQQELAREAGDTSRKIDISKNMSAKIESLDLTFDPKPEDAQKITVSAYVKKELKGIPFLVEGQAKEDLLRFMPNFRTAVGEVMQLATSELRRQAYKIILDRVNVLIRQYEGMFENLKQYRDKVYDRAQKDLLLHDRVDDRCVFVGASQRMKRTYYRGIPSVRMVLENATVEACSSAGKVIFETLLERTATKIKTERTSSLMRDELDEEEEVDTYSDLGDVFDAIVSIYFRELQENADYLKTNVIGAIVHQICEVKDLNEKKIRTDPESREVFRHAFIAELKNVVAKAAPMLRYSRTDDGKTPDGVEDVSKAYILLGMDPKAQKELASVYPDLPEDKLMATLMSSLDLTNTPSISDAFSPYEMFCFRAVHRLQPSQLYRFNEENEGSYYEYYRDHLNTAVEGNTLSMTGHIDKRWHMRGAMPYISRKLESKWREELMKAFILCTLDDMITIGEDANGRKCFRYNEDYICWPAGKPVMADSISKVFEFLMLMEPEIPRLAANLDLAVEYQISQDMVGYTGSLANYKQGMTRNPLLAELRKSLVIHRKPTSSATMAHGKNFEPEKESELPADEQKRILDLRQMLSGGAVVEPEKEKDLKKTMGGLLEVAWEVHKSEENLGLDRDYGEALLRSGAGIIDKFCRNMYGNDRIINENSAEYQEYVELYNHAMTKMVEEFVVSMARRWKLTAEQLASAPKKSSYVPAGPGNYPDLPVPEVIRSSREFQWIAKNWVLKGAVGGKK